MDLVLHEFDRFVGDKLYSSLGAALATPTAQGIATAFGAKLSIGSLLSRKSVPRQLLSLFALTYLGIFFLYFSFALISYYTIFDHRMKTHPRFLPNQIKQEIKLSMDSFVPVGLLTLPWFLGDVRGYSQLYSSLADAPKIPGLDGKLGQWTYLAASAVGFLLFTDYTIYWIHRMLHHPMLYKRLHKPHHRFIIPTPFASHAFHPLDGYVNSLPYHVYCYIVPVHKLLFISLFVLVNLWTIFIHDSDMICDSPLEAYINGPSHHTLHHLHFNVNYGQYFTYADKFGGSFRNPAHAEDPMIAVLKAEEKARLAAADDVDSASSGIGSDDDDSGFEEGSGAESKKVVEVAGKKGKME